MRFCRYNFTDDERQPATAYARVEEREGALWAVEPYPAPPEDLRASPDTHFSPTPLASLSLLPPVTPGKIVCVGRNYREHAAELGHDVPSEPLLFLKPPSSLLEPGGTIRMPPISRRVDFEGELGVVIGRRCRHLGAEVDVRSCVRGYTIVNDVTARDLQRSDGQWTRAKGFDTFCPAGPLVSDEIDPTHAPVTLTTFVNGEQRQAGSTAEMIFGVPDLLRFISAVMTLEPGDLITTGTPAGVGALAPGDRIQISIGGLGTLVNEAGPSF